MILHRRSGDIFPPNVHGAKEVRSIKAIIHGTVFEMWRNISMPQNISLEKVNRFLLCGVLITVVLYYAQKVLIPLTFSIFFAMLFTPLSNRMEKAGMKRVFSALISILIIMAVTLGISWLVYLQSKDLVRQFPEIEKRLEQFLKQAQAFVSEKLSIPQEKQDDLISTQLKNGASQAGKMVKGLMTKITTVAGGAVIVLVLTFLFLYQREKYESFFVRVYRQVPPEEAKKAIKRVSEVAHYYLIGRVLSVIIFTVLFTLGFLIVGLKNAFLLALIAALLTIVPYVGSIIGGFFPAAVALVTGDSISIAVGAVAVVGIVQVVDNYFIEPYIIGGEVNISGLFTILIMFVGGLVWGIAGMILFIPMLGVVKVIFDTVPSLKPYGYLIGDQKDGKQVQHVWTKLKKIFKKKS